MTAMVLSMPAAALPPVVTATLQQSVRVTHVPVSLADVAHIDSRDADCARYMATLILLQTAMPGIPQILRRDEIEAQMASAPVLQRCTLQLEGADTTAVVLKGVPANMNDLIRRAQQTLQETLVDHYVNVVVTPVKTEFRPIEVTAGATFKFNVPAQGIPRRRMAVQVLVQAPDELGWSYPVWFDVQASAPAWTTTAELHAGGDVAAVGKRRELVDVTQLAGEPLPEDFNFDGYVSKAPLPEGSVLTREMLVRAPQVIAGRPVSLQYQSGEIRIEVSATALQSGYIGDRVRVRNGRSDQDVMGEVNGPGMVRVMP